MKNIDWNMAIFVGESLIHEYWVFWGLPRVYYWDLKREYTPPK